MLKCYKYKWYETDGEGCYHLSYCSRGWYTRNTLICLSEKNIIFLPNLSDMIKRSENNKNLMESSCIDILNLLSPAAWFNTTVHYSLLFVDRAQYTDSSIGYSGHNFPGVMAFFMFMPCKLQTHLCLFPWDRISQLVNVQTFLVRHHKRLHNTLKFYLLICASFCSY